MATATKDTIKEAEFLNFLTKYDLEQYHEGFLAAGIKKIEHLNHVKQEDLTDIGLSRTEGQRLLDKYDRHFSKIGKFKDKLLRKGKKYAASPNAAQALEQANVDPGAMLIDDSDIRMLDKIGEGAHGIVYEGNWDTRNGMLKVAIKVLTDNDDVTFLTEFLKEANVMLKLQHPNIIKMYGVILTPTRLIEEYAALGDLHSYLMNDKNVFTVKMTHGYAKQIASAMNYLEDKRMLHRDLAVRNILVYTKDTLKLSDFGMARVLDEYSDVYKLSNLASRVPIAWSALEVLTEAKFSAASDVWSYGVTLWEIYSLGAAPWRGLNPIEIRDKLLTGERLSKPKRCHQRMYDLMLLCWTRTPRDRPKFVEVVKLLTEIHYEEVLAIRDCNADGDADLLPFKVGDKITIIDKNSDEWWTGINDKDGQFGHFQASQVIPVKNNVKSKRKSATVISSPTNIVHRAHVGSDGTKWSTEPNPANTSPPAPQRHERDTDANLIQLDEEMRNVTGGQDSEMRHYDTPRTMSKSTSSPDIQQHPIPKPRHKLLKAATVDVDEPPYANRAAIKSQYSHLQSDSTDPSALITSPTHSDDYIAGHRKHHYQNIDDRYEYAHDWLGSNDKTAPDELVIQPSRRAEAYAKTSFNHPQPGTHDCYATIFPAHTHHHKATTSPPLNSDIRYPPPLVSEAPSLGTLPGSQYDALRIEDQHPHILQRTSPLVNRQLQDRRHSYSPEIKKKTDHRRGSDTPPTTRKTAGPYDHLIISIKESLPQASEAVCLQYLTKNKGNMERSLQDIKVHILMDMGLENTTTEDCCKALGHCQWKLDRAAEWLIEQSIS
ncbi:non-receptor tyrosine-protein kinase TNK1-like isoform X2 [Dysidea avara]|uniref:non-receptor tyrosine-protein kinase TNK1-like isoform X2 n=1 Tax=Dysidea avara TaxID=196820 RepID=UPI0033227E48